MTMYCINCNLCIDSRIGWHDTGELPSPMYSILKSWIAPVEILPSSVICDQCCDILCNINDCDNSETPTRMFGHNNVCPGCGISMNRIRIHKLPADCLERKAIGSWSGLVVTRQLDYVCYPCWTKAHRSMQRYHDSSREERHHDSSKERYHDSSRQETHHVSSKDESYHDRSKDESYHDGSREERHHVSSKDESYHDSSREERHVSSKTERHHDSSKKERHHNISRGESFVVKPSLDTLPEYACEQCCEMMRRRRSKKTCMGCGGPITKVASINDEANCDSSLRLRTDLTAAGTHMFDSKESVQQELCTRYSGARNFTTSMEIKRDNSTIDPVSPKTDHTPTGTVTMQKYKRLSATSRRCLFRECSNNERHSVPLELREKLLLDFSLYIPKNCRLCSDHLNCYDWKVLCERNHSSEFTSSQVEDMLTMTRECALRPYNFSNMKYMRPELCQYWLGITTEEFYEMLNGLPLLKSNVKPELSLAVYLLKRRTGESNSRLSMLLDIPLSTFEYYLQTAHRCLEAAKATRVKEQ